MLACETGFCGNKVECEGRGGVPPVSLAEFTLAPKAGEKDFYDVSYVDGYNIPLTVEPVAGTYKKTTNTAYDCTKCGACSADVNQVAPDDLKQVVNGKTVAVYTACTKFHTDEYCCAGEHNVPEKCKPEQWPREDYYSSLKKICPTGYWYAYDDLTSTFACVGGEGRTSPDYNVVFC